MLWPWSKLKTLLQLLFGIRKIGEFQKQNSHVRFSLTLNAKVGHQLQGFTQQYCLPLKMCQLIYWCCDWWEEWSYAAVIDTQWILFMMLHNATNPNTILWSIYNIWYFKIIFLTWEALHFCTIAQKNNNMTILPLSHPLSPPVHNHYIYWPLEMVMQKHLWWHPSSKGS